MDGYVSSYLERPTRSEAAVSAERTAAADRAALYERVLKFDEATAKYVARQDWHARFGHWVGLLRDATPGYIPVPSERLQWVEAQLRADKSAAFWSVYVDDLVDLAIILDELADEAPDGYAGQVAVERASLRQSIQLARGVVALLTIEHERRKAGGA